MSDAANDFQARVTAAQELADQVRSTGQRLNVLASGLVVLFHSTSDTNAQAIKDSGGFKGNTWFAPSKAASLLHAKPKHKKTATVEIAIDAREIEFSTGTGEFYAPGGLKRGEAGQWYALASPTPNAEITRRAKEAADLVERMGKSGAEKTSGP